LEMDRKHWLSPRSQLYTRLACYKSQFVSQENEGVAAIEEADEVEEGKDVKE
jgi:hypothetical protein